jgi:hypothetical protein
VASAPFNVGAPPAAPAPISVVKSGFSTTPIGSQTFLYCGVELRNASQVSDARDLTVTVTFADTQGRSIVSDELHLSLIPAGQIFYASCLKTSSVTLSVASLQVGVKVGKSVSKSAELPSVSGLTLAPDQYGAQTLSGNLTNSYTWAMSQDATIYAVYFDSNGNIVGGSSTQAGAAVQPGATVAFSFPYLNLGVASAQVSVDPCGALAVVLGDCTVP